MPTTVKGAFTAQAIPVIQPAGGQPMRAIGPIFLIFVLLAGLAPSAGAAESSRLVVETAAGPRVFMVEVATNDETRQRGLMFRRNLAADAGMLFDYGTPQPIAMWMKNTLIPLDMLFIGSDLRVTRIAERTVPQSLTTIDSGGPARAVLEVNAGTAARLGIKPGDLVRHPLFKNALP
jgi:uncharacterized membrane protein (UPF0127 family)